MRTEKTLSTSSFKIYRISILVLGFFLLGGYVWSLSRNTSRMLAVAVGAFYVFYFYRFWFPKYKVFFSNFRVISYDEEELFISQGDSELVFGLEDVSDVELISLDGIYKFKMSNEEIYYCKPSAWYPLNFKKVDAELNRIRKLVKDKKSRFWDERGRFQNLPSS